ncbi:opine dehydrogenase [Arthrobacter sp. V4I6]|uniref:NAD/NADP octopine/nopaline dehydrogenase family protein n=1 Tax=unclassified Arthrobacter TaxID=235627 RepID=UPI002786D93D|nr:MULTISPECIES: NAD/NADP octopine/nopaline dehydrogenase family protein [unclassified Arthrobacter]MDQ0819489.1 opine dehydrogenase [Arthrobacter sp. V1I7]MDQ0853671.1 opine dehydrogenase [Arthrobacter sp. V4I6]
MKLTVVGSSSAAIVTAGYAASNAPEGWDVALLAGSEIQDIPHYADGLVPEQVLALEVSATISGSDLFVLVGTANDLPVTVVKHADIIGGRPVLVAPGSFGGAFRVRNALRMAGVENPNISETTGFIAGGRVSEGRCTVTSVKRNLPVAGFSDELSAKAMESFLPCFPTLVASDLVTTSLSNTNNVLHPPVVIANATAMDKGKSFTFYDEGLSQATENLLLAVDRERLRIVQECQGETLTLREWMLRFYADQGMAGRSINECLRSFSGFQGSLSPSTLDTRYLTEDIPFGFVPLERLAARLRLPHDAISAVRVLSETFIGRVMETDEECIEDFLAYVHQRQADSVLA